MMEEKVTDISHNIALLMVDLEINIKPFKEVGYSNSEIGSEGKLRDNEDLEKESRKDPKKEKPSSSENSPSQSLFKMEEKVDIKPCQCDIDVVNLNHWLEQLEVYFSVHHME
jgi:hypothetical protein